MQNIQTIATIGEILVEFVSHKKGCGLSEIAEFSGPYPSGAPAIFLDQAARMGISTEMIGGVGDDGFGRIVLDRLRENQVGVNGVHVSPDHTTGVAFVSYYEDGSRDFIFHLNNTAVDAFERPPATSDLATTLLHVSASSLGNAAMRDKIMAMVHDVIKAGGKISCDPNARPELMSDGAVKTAMQEVMDHSYCLMPSTSDLDFLFPDLSEDAAVEQLLQAKAEIIVIKRGEHGATVLAEGERYDFEGHKMDELDPTGAGDCFCGTFISLVAQGVPFEEAGARANAAGAIAVTRRGPMEGNSTPEEITAFLNQTDTQKAAQ